MTHKCSVVFDDNEKTGFALIESKDLLLEVLVLQFLRS